MGFNASTGMNGTGAGEDVVWWDGVPHGLDVGVLAPMQDDLAEAWEVSGAGWSLQLEFFNDTATTENLLVVHSAYVQPIGRFVGTLPDPSGRPVEVSLMGVTEDHRARW